MAASRCGVQFCPGHKYPTFFEVSCVFGGAGRGMRYTPISHRTCILAPAGATPSRWASGGPMTQSRHIRVEVLEDRLAPSTSGVTWPDGGHLTLSFVPDGTQVGN